VIDTDAAELAPQARDHQREEAGQRDEHDAEGELEAVGPQVGRNPPELAESVAVQLAFPRWRGVGILGCGGCVSGHRDGGFRWEGKAMLPELAPRR